MDKEKNARSFGDLAFFRVIANAYLTVRERAFVTNKLRLTPSLSALLTNAWCSDLGRRTVNLPLYLR